MATTISRYLKLKIDDNLSADAKSNLAKIDELGAIFRTNAEDNVDISAKGNISLQPGDPAIGGTPNSGTITFGDTNNTTASVDFYSTAVRLRSKLQIENGVSGQNTTFLSLAAEVENTNADLTFSLADSLSTVASRSVIIGHSGRLVFEDANQVLTNKTVTGTFTGPLTGNVTGNVTGTSANVTGVVAVVNGGTGASAAPAAIANLLPSYATNANKVLGLNLAGTDLEWKVVSAGGTVSAVVSPLVQSLDLTTISLPQSTALADGYLSASDWSLFNGKQAAITGAATTITDLNLTNNRAVVSSSGGKIAASTVTTTELDTLIGISTLSSVQSQLDGKYSTSNPAGYINAAAAAAAAPVQSVNGLTNVVVLDTDDVGEGATNLYFTDSRAKTAAVVNSTAGSEIDQAPSVSAVKSYVAAQGGGSVAYLWENVNGLTKTIAHNLNKTTISVTVYDENGEDILVDIIDRTDVNTISLTSSVAPPGAAPTGNWTVVIRP